MRRRSMVVLLTATAVGLLFAGLGAASVSAKVGGRTSAVAIGAASSPSSSSATVKPHPFGHTVSGLRQAGDHTPAAVLMGKKVPGHGKKTSGDGVPTAVTEEAPAPPPAVDDAAEDSTGPEPKVSRGNGKSHTPAAVLKGKKVPGQSK